MALEMAPAACWKATSQVAFSWAVDRDLMGPLFLAQGFVAIVGLFLCWRFAVETRGRAPEAIRDALCVKLGFAAERPAKEVELSDAGLLNPVREKADDAAA